MIVHLVESQHRGTRVARVVHCVEGRGDLAFGPDLGGKVAILVSRTASNDLDKWLNQDLTVARVQREPHVLRDERSLAAALLALAHGEQRGDQEGLAAPVQVAARGPQRPYPWLVFAMATA